MYYSPTEIQAAFSGLIGWRQNPDVNSSQLLDLTASITGLYFNDAHPLLTHNNLLSIAPDFSLISRAAWGSGTAYSVGNVVSHSSKIWVSIQAGTNQTPGPGSAYWQETNEYTLWLKEKTDAAIIQGLIAWMEEKAILRTAGSLMERKRLFDAAGRMENVTAITDKMCGLEVAVCRHLGLKSTLHEVGLQFDATGTVTLYLFKSDQVNPVQTSDPISYAEAGTQQWATLNWELEPNGTYFICYKQDAAPGSPVNGVADYVLGQGGSINSSRLDYFPMGRFFRVLAFEAAGTVSNLWDIASNTYSSSVNYGLNLKMSVQCDYTDLLIEQKQAFKMVVFYKVALNLVNEIIFNADAAVNRYEANQAERRAELIYERDGDSRGRRSGLRNDFERALKAVAFDTTGIDKVCLPCRRRGVRYTTV